MKTIETMVNQLTNSSRILGDIKELLMQIDPRFPAEEERYTHSAARLRELWDSADVYLAAREACYASAVIYMAWQGIRLNMDVFGHPVHSLLLQGDFEHLCREERLAALPAYSQAQRTVRELHKAQPKEAGDLIDSISDYYAHLETVGYKVAHYGGYRFADTYLRSVIPGYVSSPSDTSHYRVFLSNYLQIDLRQLG